MVAAQSAVNVRGGVEDDLRTGVVATCATGCAGGFAAGDAAFEGDAVALCITSA